jgi:hypothetical protein
MDDGVDSHTTGVRPRLQLEALAGELLKARRYNSSDGYMVNPARVVVGGSELRSNRSTVGSAIGHLHGLSAEQHEWFQKSTNPMSHEGHPPQANGKKGSL